MKTARELIVAALGLLVFFVLFFAPAEFGALMASGVAFIETIPLILGPHNLWEPGMLLGYPLFVDDQPSRLTLATHCARPCFLVVRDAFDPQWRALVDGADARIVPADLALRGIALPAGDHSVTFVFVPSSLYLGFAMCAFAAIVSVALVVLAGTARSGSNTFV
jgi:hypothetical protein